MVNFQKYSIFLSDIKLSANDFFSETGSGFEDELESVISAFASAEAQYGVIYLTPQEASVFNMGKKISAIFKKAEHVAIFVTTLGRDYISVCQRYRGDPLYYYLADIIASALIERCADLAHKKISLYANSIGLKCSNRYSPGYCGWSTSEQKILFSLLPPHPCGIKLTESSLMDPVKSISAAVALGEKIRYHNHDCSSCNDENCLYKKKQIL